MTPMLRSIRAFALLLVLAMPLSAQEVRYDIAFPNAVHHEAEITVTWTGLPNAPLEVRMSRTSPGRYALHEFAKNVYSVSAVDGADRALRITRPDPYGWDVHGHDGTVQFRYTLYGDRADGTYTGIDLSHGHLNMPATFAWARGTETRPIGIRFEVPAESGWKVATQLEPTDDPYTFRAPHLDYFLDSPTELSDWDERTWTVQRNGEPQTIRLVVHHQGTDAELDAYAEMAQKVTAEQIAMWGEAPEFDFGTYTFLACYLPWVAGDGMEHRNSTILTSTGSLENPMGVLGTLSHELFHAWNVERLRPADLEPFDFENADMSGLLWFAEGFTSYYDGLFIRRAGITTDQQFADDMGGALNAVINGRGRRYFTPVEMSMQAPFVDAAAAIDPNNRANTFISYYTWGSVIGLGLDLSIRTQFAGRSLDDYMRALWTKYGQHQRDYAPARPFTIADLRATLGEVTSVPFANAFFDRYIEGTEVPDFQPLLAAVGMELRRAAPDSASLGQLPLQKQGERMVVTGATLVGTPVYEAGLDRGDVLVSIDGRRIAEAVDVRAAIAGKRPGDQVAIEYEQRGARRSVTVALMADEGWELVPVEGEALTVGMRGVREEWLGARARRD
jgi:predicted metalloprotease with PDZ domain